MAPGTGGQSPGLILALQWPGYFLTSSSAALGRVILTHRTGVAKTTSKNSQKHATETLSDYRLMGQTLLGALPRAITEPHPRHWHRPDRVSLACSRKEACNERVGDRVWEHRGIGGKGRAGAESETDRDLE